MPKIKVLKVLCDRSNFSLLFAHDYDNHLKQKLTYFGPASVVPKHLFLQAEVEEKDSAKYGKSIVLKTWTALEPVNGLREKFASIPTIGVKTAELLVTALKAKSIEENDVISNPNIILELKNTDFHPKLWPALTKIKEHWVDNDNISNDLQITQVLASYGVSPKKIPSLAQSISLALINENIFELYWREALSFSQCDDIFINKQNKPKDDPIRIKVHVEYYFSRLEAEGGLYERLKTFVKNMAINMDVSKETITNAITNGIITLYSKTVNDFEYVTSDAIRTVERELSNMILQIANNKCGNVQFAINDSFNEDQQLAIKRAFKYGFTIITGFPGTGKSTTIKEIINIMDSQETPLKYMLLAPTGTAAKNLEEYTHHDVMTIHRFLAKTEIYGGHYDYYFIDEISMVDMRLMHTLLTYITKTTPNAKIVCIGDVEQIPSISGGQILKDMIDSYKIKTTFLTKVYRQKTNSNILKFSRNLIKGNIIDINPEWPDLKYEEYTSLDDIKRVLKKHEFNKENLFDSVVLVPQRKGSIGSTQLNNILQKLYNPTGESIIQTKEFEIRKGDKIIQKKNNYEKNVFNGTMGCVIDCKINGTKKEVSILFGDIVINYMMDELLDNIELCYSMTIHKSQGHQYKKVLILLHSYHSHMLNRNLVYTGMTRAKEHLVIYGNNEGLTASTAVMGKRVTFLFDE
jgi:exodeoxyribonuclease V alpha subunit